MSKSSPPATSIVTPKKQRRNDSAELTSPRPPIATNGKSFATQFGAVVRWLHIYVSLLGFTALVFFALTGVTLNHPTWFGMDAEHVAEHQGEIDKAWLNQPLPASQSTKPTDESEEVDYALQVDKLTVVEHLRKTHHIRGYLSEFRVDERECLILFKGPGYAADVTLDRETGSYQLTETVLGAVAVINDLHKGRDTGLVWSWVIDVSAILMVFVSITGIVLIFYIRRKRLSGIITAVVGTILFAALYFWFVP